LAEAAPKTLSAFAATRLERIGHAGAGGAATLALGVAGLLATYAVHAAAFAAIAIALATSSKRGARIEAGPFAIAQTIDVHGNGAARDARGRENWITLRLADANAST
jgi:hypothetical protein